mmetsp:Transcript_2180/g.14443  ORF Transcript_2180/g.14443 Transcript_2180/m.14443 type:complete len:115 (-) Transcript_2180:1638-1982(-)
MTVNTCWSVSVAAIGCTRAAWVSRDLGLCLLASCVPSATPRSRPVEVNRGGGQENERGRTPINKAPYTCNSMLAVPHNIIVFLSLNAFDWSIVERHRHVVCMITSLGEEGRGQG